MGGEPTLHPQFYQICLKAREIFPLPVMIDVMTNGINVSPIIDDMDELRENQIGISFCYYPGYTDIEKSNFCIKNDCGIGLNTRLTMN